MKVVKINYSPDSTTVTKIDGLNVVFNPYNYYTKAESNSKFGTGCTSNYSLTGDTTFIGFTASTNTAINSKLDVSEFNTYTGDSNSNLTIVTGNTTLSINDHYVIVNTLVNPVTVYLPENPPFKKIYKLKDKGNGYTNNVTINGNGKNIDGYLIATIDSDYGGVELLFDGSEWLVVSFVN